MNACAAFFQEYYSEASAWFAGQFLHRQAPAPPLHKAPDIAPAQLIRPHRFHPEKMQRKHSKPRCVGQKQRWFFLQLVGDQSKIKFDATGHPEFDDWEWVSYWHPINQVVSFKQNVYRQALSEFAQTNVRFQKRRKRR